MQFCVLRGRMEPERRDLFHAPDIMENLELRKRIERT